VDVTTATCAGAVILRRVLWPGQIEAAPLGLCLALLLLLLLRFLLPHELRLLLSCYRQACLIICARQLCEEVGGKADAPMRS
jgi:hypothetical protein